MQFETAMEYSCYVVKDADATDGWNCNGWNCNGCSCHVVKDADAIDGWKWMHF